MTQATPAANGRFLRGGPPRRLLPPRTVIVLAAGVLVLLLMGPLMGENGLASYLRLRAETRELEGRVAALRQEAAEIEARIEALKEDPAELERLARERYGMQRKGEQVLQVVGRTEPAQAPAR